MLFNSYEFILLFLPITFIVYFLLVKNKLFTASTSWLVVASLFFYSCWNVIYLPLILISIIFNYLLSTKIIEYDTKNYKNISKKQLLYIGLIFNIGLLVYFKYMDFFITTANISLGTDFSLLSIALPLAISFFTLQQIAFLVDSYENLVKKSDFLNYTLFVTFFPQLIAGPIVHYKEMMPQFLDPKNKIINNDNISLGIFIFSIGLFKKVILADTFATWANYGYDHSTVLTLFEAWATSLSYTFQLYFDFSGYMDMAIGIALLFNIKLPINFNSPYKATSIIDFWNRWHITLTKFITTYIYSPSIMALSNITFLKSMMITFMAMLISGLWHGAEWTFVLWGAIHGCALVINHYWRRAKIKLNKFIAWFITFNFINFTLIIFRANDLNDVSKVLEGMFGLNGIVLPSFLVNNFSYLSEYGIKFGGIAMNIKGGMDTFIWLIFGFIIIFLFDNSIKLKDKFKPTHTTLLFTSLLFFYSIASISEHSTFLYFNF